MRKFTIITIITLFLLSFSSGAFASNVEKNKFRTFKQGKMEVTSNLPDDINPTVVSESVDKDNIKKQAPGKVNIH